MPVRLKKVAANAEQFMEIVHKNAHFEVLTHTFLSEFVYKIIVYECSYNKKRYPAAGN